VMKMRMLSGVNRKLSERFSNLYSSVKPVSFVFYKDDEDDGDDEDRS
jgi:hypothetical protein